MWILWRSEWVNRTSQLRDRCRVSVHVLTTPQSGSSPFSKSEELVRCGICSWNKVFDKLQRSAEGHQHKAGDYTYTAAVSFVMNKESLKQRTSPVKLQQQISDLAQTQRTKTLLHLKPQQRLRSDPQTSFCCRTWFWISLSVAVTDWHNILCVSMWTCHFLTCLSMDTENFTVRNRVTKRVVVLVITLTVFLCLCSQLWWVSQRTTVPP